MSVTRSARKIRLSSKSTRHQAIAAISAATSLVAWAAVSKADTFGFNDSATTLNTSTAWTDETSPTTDTAPPGANDTAQFDSLAGLSGTTTLTLGVSTNWGALSVLSPGADITIGTVADSTNTLTLGSTVTAGGINMSAATQNLTIVDPLAMAINQSFLVNTGQTLTLNGAVNISTATLTFGGGGTQIVNGAINDGGAGGAIAESGSGTVILTASNSFTGSTTLSSGVMELDFSAAGAPASNILPSAAQLRLGGGTLLVNGGAAGGSQTFASTATNGPTFVTSGLSVVDAVSNGTAPTVTLGTMTVNQISTNLGGQVEFIGPATSTDGLNVNPVAATATISVGSTPTIVDVGKYSSSIRTVSMPSPSWVNPVIPIRSPTLPLFRVAWWSADRPSPDSTLNTPPPLGKAAAAMSTFPPLGSSASAARKHYTTLRFNTPTGGMFNSDGNNMDQVLIKSGKALTTGAILVTPNVGANNIAIVLAECRILSDRRKLCDSEPQQHYKCRRPEHIPI